MANAAVVRDNLALSGRVYASSQELAMPASELLTPHPSDVWRSKTNADWFVLDKGGTAVGDTIIVNGLTCGVNSTGRLRLSLSDASGAVGDVADVTYLAGSANFDTEYGTFVHLLSSPLAWRYARFDGVDPDAAYFEAGLITAGVREAFTYNFQADSGVQDVDRSRVAPTASGKTLTWRDNHFRRIDLNFDWVPKAQRYGLWERMRRANGRHLNVALILDTASDNLARDTVVGLLTDLTPTAYGRARELFGTQLRMDERI